MVKEEKQAEKKAPDTAPAPTNESAKGVAQKTLETPPPVAAQGGAAPQDGAPAKEIKPARRKVQRNIAVGIVHVNATFNNTQVSITDLKGAVLAWSSAGRMGFKGTRKSTAYAATVVAQDAARQVSAYRMQELEVRVQGPGAGRESAIRALQASGLTVTMIRDITSIPHNGCRPRKRRRV